MHYHAADGSCDWHQPTSFPVGIMDIDARPVSANLVLEPGDILALISDGVYEYRNTAGEQYGDERVAGVFKAHGHLPAAGLAEKLIKKRGLN